MRWTITIHSAPCYLRLGRFHRANLFMIMYKLPEVVGRHSVLALDQIGEIERKQE